jgi:hypothetical protein
LLDDDAQHDFEAIIAVLDQWKADAAPERDKVWSTRILSSACLSAGLIACLISPALFTLHSATCAGCSLRRAGGGAHHQEYLQIRPQH